MPKVQPKMSEMERMKERLKDGEDRSRSPKQPSSGRGRRESENGGVGMEKQHQMKELKKKFQC